MAKYTSEKDKLARQLVDAICPTASLVDAIGNNDLVGARKALEAGATMNIKVGKDETPLFQAAIYAQDSDVLKLFIEFDAWDMPNYRGELALHIATAISSPEMVEILLTHGYGANDCTDIGSQWDGLAKTEHGQRMAGSKALHIAVSTEPTEEAIQCFELLLKHGADIHAVNNHGETPLHTCTDPYWTSRLIELGANIHAKTVQGHTPAHCAAIQDSSAVLEVLHEAGASLDVENYQGSTPIEYMRGHPHSAYHTMIAEYEQAKLKASVPQANKSAIKKGGVRL